jgi:hypothetical protein
MLHKKLTQDRVRKALCPADKQQIFIWDTNVKGLGVRVTATSKSYIFQDKLGGKSIRIKIGDADTWPIDSTDPDHPGARQEAARLKALFDQGIDPRAEKLRIEAERAAEIAEAKRQKVTVGEVWHIYLEDRKQHWSARHYRDHLRLSHPGGTDKRRGKGKTIPAALATLMPIKLSGMTPEVVQKWASKESKTRPGQARLAFSLIRAFVNWCEDHQHYRGLCTPSSFSGRIKKANIPKQLPKQDTLQREQLPAWFASVKKIPNPFMSTYLQVLLLTRSKTRRDFEPPVESRRVHLGEHYYRR